MDRLTVDIKTLREFNVKNRSRDFKLKSKDPAIFIDNANRLSTGHMFKSLASRADDELNLMYMTLKDDVFDSRLKSNEAGTSVRLLASMDRFLNLTVLSPDTARPADYYNLIRRYLNGERPFALVLFDVYPT
jgi:hypothetical protein